MTALRQRRLSLFNTGMSVPAFLPSRTLRCRMSIPPLVAVIQRSRHNHSSREMILGGPSCHLTSSGFGNDAIAALFSAGRVLRLRDEGGFEEEQLQDEDE